MGIVLADFGVSRVLDNTMAMATTMVGTPLSMAPEVYQGRSYTTKSDIWSYGIVLYEVCARTVPFGGRNFAEVQGKVLHDPEPPLPQAYRDLMEIYHGCLQKEPRKRLTSKQIVSHKIIEGVIRKLKKKK